MICKRAKCTGNMARKGAGAVTETCLKFLALSLFVRHVSSQACTAPYPQTCTCSESTFTCTSANLTSFPSDIPNSDTLQSIDLSNNTITFIGSDALSAYTQLQTLVLVGNDLTNITAQRLTANFKKIDLSSNPIVCGGSLAWLVAVDTVQGTCSSGQDLAAFIDGLKATTVFPSTAQTRPISNVTYAQPDPLSTVAVTNTTVSPPQNKYYVLAIIIPVLLIVVVVIAVVIISIRKNRKQQEAYNSAIRYSVVRKDAGAPSNRVYSDVTTEL